MWMDSLCIMKVMKGIVNAYNPLHSQIFHKKLALTS